MGQILLPFGSIATSKEAVLVDFWQAFDRAKQGLHGRLIGTVDAPGETILEWTADGDVWLNRSGGQPTLYFPAKLRGLDQHRAHYRIFLDRDRILFGAAKPDESYNFSYGVYRRGPRRLLAHYKFAEEQAVVAANFVYPIDEGGQRSGTDSIYGQVSLGAKWLNYPSIGDFRALLIDGQYYTYLGNPSVYGAVFASGVVLDFFADLTKSVDVRVDDEPGGDTLFRIYRTYPDAYFHVVYRDSAGTDQEVIAYKAPTVGVGHVLFNVNPVLGAIMLAVDGSLNDLDANPGVAVVDFFNCALEQLRTCCFRVGAYGSSPPQNTAIANLRVWDAFLPIGNYSVPADFDAAIPEMQDDLGFVLTGIPGVPDVSTVTHVNWIVAGDPGETHDIADASYFENVSPLPLDGNRYEIPDFDDDFPGLTLVPVEGVHAENVAIAFDYPAKRATISAMLVSDAPQANVEVMALFSLDGEKWVACQDGDYNVVTGLNSSPGGVYFAFEWDLGDVLLGDRTASFYVTLVAREDAPGNYFPSPREAAIQTTIGPEQSLATVVNSTPIVSPVSGNVNLDYELLDRDSELCWIDVEYSVDGGGTSWHDCSEGPGSDGKEALATSPTGVAHRFVWDTEADAVRGAWALVRISPKKEKAPDPRLVADFGFENQAPVAAWEFGSKFAPSPIPIPAYSARLPFRDYGVPAGNAGRFQVGNPALGWGGLGEYLELAIGAGLQTDIGLPYAGIPNFGRAEVRGFCAEVCARIDTADRVIFQAVSGGDRAILVRLEILATGCTLFVETVGGGTYIIADATPALVGSFYAYRLTILPTDSGFRAVLIRDGATVLFDALRPRPARIFRENEVFAIFRAHGLPGTVCEVDHAVLLDSPCFVGAFTPPASLDITNGEWLPDFPKTSDGLLQGVYGAGAAAVFLADGKNGKAMAFDWDDVIIPGNRGIRTATFRSGFGMEFHSKVGDALGVFVNLIEDPAIPVDLLRVVGTENPVPQPNGSCYVEARYGGVNWTRAYFPVAAAGDWWMDDKNWHHFRISVRRNPPYVLGISLDGSQPSFLTMPALPDLFQTPATERFVEIGNDTYGGGDRSLIDDLKIWDGYHTSPYPVPVPAEPQYSYWRG